MSRHLFSHGAFARYVRDEGGAVTVDYIVLTAAAAVLGIAIVGEMRSPTAEIASEVSSAFAGDTITIAQKVEEDDNTDSGFDDTEIDIGNSFFEPEPDPQQEPDTDPQPDPEPEPDPAPEEPTGPPPGCWYNGAGTLKCK